MCQGRFRQAEELAAALDGERDAEQVELAADIARLRHLGYRFALDYDTAGRLLEQAE